ncbi:hypothetical protein [Bacillus marinisedimentorum]|nr:hypothetical protein [Bacillus marinisedimentorum]
MGMQGMMSQAMGFGILAYIVNLLVMGAVVYIAVRLALKNNK